MEATKPKPVKKLLFWSVILIIPFLFALSLLEGYYAYKKFTYPGLFCGSFAKLDSRIGWTLKPNTQSCYAMKKPGDSSSYAFNTKIFIDDNGFRSARLGTKTPIGGIMVVGDSHTFGFGVDYEGTYAAQLGKITGAPVVIAASPAYSSAQAIALAQRWIGKLKPTALIYLDIGLWGRAACRGTSRPTLILKPCYWENPKTNNVELVFPPENIVMRAAKIGLKPGGMLGAGENGLPYFLTRPISRFVGILARLGIVSAMAHDFAPVGVDDDKIKLGVARHLNLLAQKAKVPLIVIDPANGYAQLRTSLAKNISRFSYIGTKKWQAEIGKPAELLPAEQRKVPHDGHYGPGTNRLIAELLARELAKFDSLDKTE